MHHRQYLATLVCATTYFGSTETHFGGNETLSGCIKTHVGSNEAHFGSTDTHSGGTDTSFEVSVKVRALENTSTDIRYFLSWLLM